MNELRQTKIKMLKYAIKNMRNHHGICAALAAADDDNVFPHSLKALYELTTYIRKQLIPYVFYESWVAHNHKELHRKMNYKDFTKGRIAWCNWMIQCLEEDEAKENGK